MINIMYLKLHCKYNIDNYKQHKLSHYCHSNQFCMDSFYLLIHLNHHENWSKQKDKLNNWVDLRISKKHMNNGI